MAPLVQSAVLTDRRHILTKDAGGNVELWDVATGAAEQHFGKVGPAFSPVCALLLLMLYYVQQTLPVKVAVPLLLSCAWLSKLASAADAEVSPCQPVHAAAFETNELQCLDVL